MRRRSVGVVTTAAATVMAVTAVTGCTGAAGHAGNETGDPGPVRELTRSEQGRVEQAEQHLIQQCMRRQGFRYWVLPRVDADTDRAFLYRFVRDDVAWARAYGYGERLRKTALAAKEHDPNLTYRKGLSAAGRERYAAALQGGGDTPFLTVELPAGGAVRGPNGGCLRSARETLYGDSEAYFRTDTIASNLARTYLPKVMHDPQFTAGLRDWSRCMYRATGHHYADPAAARAGAARTGGLDTARAWRVEVKTATAEATCAHQTSLSDTLARLDRRYGDPVRERYADEIATSGRMKLAALHLADTVVTGD
ncbi:hypothetical protein [Streptomyces sp. MMBL 11-3]|uniref:hypothetical protein n=1 Tax=Streptomyces sp. MMBL 11-3 TaxID=3382639 RepID=UPI0039B65B43